MKKIVLVPLSCVICWNTALHANLGDFQLNGFLAITASWTDVDFLASGIEPTYFSYIQKRPSFDRDNNVGIQITKPLGEDISITTQLLAEGINEWDVEATWAFLKWEPNDHWQFRVGRVRTSPYMLSEYLNVAYAYPWVRPPVEVYSQIPVSFSNHTGFDVRYKINLCHRDLSISGFYGASTSHLNFPSVITPTIFDTIKLRQRDITSINIKYGDEIFSVRAGYERAKASLWPTSGSAMDALNTFLNTFVNTIPVPFPPFAIPGIGLDYINYFSVDNVTFSFMGLGYQFDWKNVVSMGEVVKRHAATPIITNAIGWYVMGGYRVKQFLPHVTFARERLQDNKIRRFNSLINSLAVVGLGQPLDVIAQKLVYTSQFYDGGAGSQTSVTVGLRWDIYEGIAIKAEAQHVHPDFTTPGLFDVKPLKSVNVYSLAVDAVM